MPIPDFQSLMLPLLEALSEGQEQPIHEVTDRLADRFALTEEERRQKLTSGNNRVFVNRVAWAKAHLKAAGLIDNPSRGKVRISAEGRRLLASRPGKVNVALLRRYPAYQAFSGQAAGAGATTADG